MHRLRPLILVCLVVAALPLQAQNLVPNPTFDVDVSGWEALPAVSLNHSASEGFASPGAAETTGMFMDASGNSIGIRQCIDLTGADLSVPLFAHAAIRPLGFGGQILVSASWIADTSCSGLSINDASIFGIAIADTWTFLQGDMGMAPAGSGSVRFTVGLITTHDDVMAMTLFDDFHLGVNPFPFFEDGFESGDTTGWTRSDQ